MSFKAYMYFIKPNLSPDVIGEKTLVDGNPSENKNYSANLLHLS